MLTLVAATIRTSVLRTSLDPTRMYSPVSSTRNNLACVCKGSSPTSSKKSVPPFAAAKYPSRCSTAPVKAPFSWPNNSESIVPSGMAPQFTAKYFLFLRKLWSWIIRGKDSFPTPFSPTTNTDKSTGAIFRAISIARLSASQFPTMP